MPALHLAADPAAAASLPALAHRRLEHPYRPGALFRTAPAGGVGGLCCPCSSARRGRRSFKLNSGQREFGPPPLLVGAIGRPVRRLPAPAIKFGGTESQKSRLVLLVCDQTNRPLKVVKLGLDATGRDATDREAGLAGTSANTLGCIHLTGRLPRRKYRRLPLTFYPGPVRDDDAGMEVLFHSWVNPGPAEPIETLDAWRELETQSRQLRSRRVAPDTGGPGRQPAICSTLYHGDFAPWNIPGRSIPKICRRLIGSRGNLQGIPGWDWFHFVVQTSILARRHSVERVAAELEELLARRALKNCGRRRHDCFMVKPLLLANLLDHRWVVQPLEGCPGGGIVRTARGALAIRPRTRPITGRSGVILALRPPRPVVGGRLGQLRSAWSQLANVFWEPTLERRRQLAR